MKKIILLLLVVFQIPVLAQNAKSLFVNMPDSVLSIFTEINRADFADFLESNMKAQVKNLLDNNSEMKVLTEDYILIETSSRSNWQMKLLAVNDSVSVICAVNTVKGPAEDSTIRFYSTDWQELPTSQFISLPVEEDFFTGTAPDQPEYETVRKAADLFLRKGDLSPGNNSLVFTYTTPEYMDKKNAEELAPYINNTVTYQWNGNRYSR